MLYFCKYKHLFGKPKEGLHSYRYMNIALVDVGLTILLAKFFQFYFLMDYNIFIIIFFSFILGILMHRLFCVRTTIDKLLFG